MTRKEAAEGLTGHRASTRLRGLPQGVVCSIRVPWRHALLLGPTTPRTLIQPMGSGSPGRCSWAACLPTLMKVS